MRNHGFLLLAAALSAAACSGSGESSAPGQAPAAGPPPAATDLIATATAGPVLRVIEGRHLFATPRVPDVFRLELQGDSLLTATAVLTIRTAAGEELYRQTLYPGVLEAALVYELKPDEPVTRARREAYVRQRRAEFFSADKFTSPALASDAVLQPEYIDLAAWNALKLPGTVGFSFLLGKEDGHRIAWVPTKKKVQRYAGFGG